MKYYSGDKIKIDEIGETCGTNVDEHVFQGSEELLS